MTEVPVTGIFYSKHQNLYTPLHNRPGQTRPGDILHWPGEINP